MSSLLVSKPAVEPFIEKIASSSGFCRRASSVCHRVRASFGQPSRWLDPRAGNQMIGALASEEAPSRRSPPPKHLKWVRVPHGGCWYPAPTGHVAQSGARIVNTQKPPARSLRPCGVCVLNCPLLRTGRGGPGGPAKLGRAAVCPDDVLNTWDMKYQAEKPQLPSFWLMVPFWPPSVNSLMEAILMVLMVTFTAGSAVSFREFLILFRKKIMPDRKI